MKYFELLQIWGAFFCMQGSQIFEVRWKYACKITGDKKSVSFALPPLVWNGMQHRYG